MAPVLSHFLKWRLGLAAPEVWTTDVERACLSRHAAGKHRVVEVGVWHGGTARVLRAAMAADGVLYAVDPFVPGRLGISFPFIIARTELGRVKNGGLVWIRQEGRDAARSAPVRAAAPFDFVFLDPPQTEETFRGEWDAWPPLVSEGGIIAVHDSRPSPEDPSFEPGSLRYSLDVIRRDARFEIVDEAGLVTVLRRN